MSYIQTLYFCIYGMLQKKLTFCNRNYGSTTIVNGHYFRFYAIGKICYYVRNFVLLHSYYGRRLMCVVCSSCKVAIAVRISIDLLLRTSILS